MQLSVWESETFFAPQDIVIIGGGLTGLWTALELKQQSPTLRITILEQGLIPAGASTRNAGFSCFGSPSELMSDMKRLGEDETWAIVEMRYRGMEKINRWFKADRIGYDRCGGYELFDQRIDTEQLQASIHHLNKRLAAITGEKQCFETATNRLNEFGFAGFTAMVGNRLEGYLHSGKLLRELTMAVQAAGVQVLTSTSVTSLDVSTASAEVHTNKGFSFRCEQVIVCTNAFTQSLLPSAGVVPARGQVLLTEPIDGLNWKGTFHFDEGYYYFRNLGNRILLGGARNLAFDAERTASFELNPEIQQHLEQFIAKHLVPGRPVNIEQRWSGIMGFTEEKKPVVQRIDERTCVALSCNGMGVALAPVIAERVSALLL